MKEKGQNSWLRNRKRQSRRKDWSNSRERRKKWWKSTKTRNCKELIKVK